MECSPLYYWRYVDDIFGLFKSCDYLKRFYSYLNFCHANMSFTMKTEQNKKISFLDLNVLRQQGKLTTNVSLKLTFSGVQSHSSSFLSDTYKIGRKYTLVNRCFRICWNRSMFHSQLILLKEIFQEKFYQKTSLIDVFSCS